MARGEVNRKGIRVAFFRRKIDARPPVSEDYPNEDDKEYEEASEHKQDAE
jgi:hypothetical protein